MKNTLLPVIESTLKTYKLWYEFRDNIPKKSRYTLGDKIDTRFLQVLEFLNTASYQPIIEKLRTLERTITGIDTLKFLLRIGWEVHAIDTKKYTALSEGVQEIGRQVGSWHKGLVAKTSAKKTEENG